MGDFRGARISKSETKKWPLILVIFIIAAAIALLLIRDTSPFQQLKKDGYKGTEEQWLASLVGETVDKNADSAYSLACQNGYTADYATWAEVLTGHSAAESSDSMYDLACQNGYQGTLQEWLLTLAQNPDKLGKSKGTQNKTEYELACDFGYEGTFIEWIVSVAYERIPN